MSKASEKFVLFGPAIKHLGIYCKENNWINLEKFMYHSIDIEIFIIALFTAAEVEKKQSECLKTVVS